MKKKKLFKIGLTIASAGIVFGIIFTIYLFNMPHRNISKTNSDYTVSVSELVDEYLMDPNSANEKYLSDDGESKILEVSGIIQNIHKDLKNQMVITLQSVSGIAGVDATIDSSSNVELDNLIIGGKITIKGVIRSGAFYDSDMEIYMNAILDKGIIL